MARLPFKERKELKHLRIEPWPIDGKKTLADIQVRYNPKEYTLEQAYELTHVMYVAFEYGARDTAAGLTAADVDYLRETLPVLVEEQVLYRNLDLTAELLSSLVYLGDVETPAAASAIDLLLTSQNGNGTWGDYEMLRIRYDRFVDQEKYLHTTFVATQAMAS